MERRHFLKLAFGVASGAALIVTAAQAAPFVHQSPANGPTLPPTDDARPAVVSGDEVQELKPEQVGWRHRHWGWRHRHWGWRHRHWGWRHRHWRRW